MLESAGRATRKRRKTELTRDRRPLGDNAMDNVQRFANVMSFRPVDRLPVVEWAPWWTQTLERWYGEGLPAELQDASAIRDYLGLDSYRQMWFEVKSNICPDAEAYTSGIVQDEGDYLRLRSRLYPRPAPFDRQELARWAMQQQAGHTVVWFTLDGFFWHPRALLGVEPHLFAFYDNPKLLHRMNEDLLAYNLWMLDEACAVCTPSFLTFAEDMSYNWGSMVSERFFDEFCGRYYRQIIPEITKRGIIPIIDSDGDVTRLIPWFEEVGIQGILPLERMAGVDVVQMRRDHPGWKMIGAFDKMVMHLGEDAMRQEFERLLPVMRSGGFIPSVDHQTPPDVSLPQYRLYLSLLREYCAKAAEP
jgi:hypothetical protein